MSIHDHVETVKLVIGRHNDLPTTAARQTLAILEGLDFRHERLRSVVRDILHRMEEDGDIPNSRRKSLAMILDQAIKEDTQLEATPLSFARLG